MAVGVNELQQNFFQRAITLYTQKSSLITSLAPCSEAPLQP